MKEYTIIIENAGPNWSAYSPDIPSCISTGASQAEVTDNMREALEMHIKALRADGLPVPEPRTLADRVRIAA